jgi:hypothetical protein
MLATQLSGQMPQETQGTSGMGRRVVAVGCLNRAVQEGSPSGAPGVPPPPPEAIPNQVNSPQPTGVLVLNGARLTQDQQGQKDTSSVAGQVMPKPATFMLEGMGPELERHLGHHLQVSGTLHVEKEGPKSIEHVVTHIRVTAIKMLAASCPEPDASGAR